MPRASGRSSATLREISIVRDFTRQAEGSVLISAGATRVICNASVEVGVPRFLRGSNRGWITAEYGMLPRSTGERMAREALRGKQGGRSVEIQRLIGRSLRAAVDTGKLGNHTIILDCDVIQADGGTRALSITGGCVALVDALRTMQRRRLIEQDPLRQMIAAVSVGMVQGAPVLDLDYGEDSKAATDMTVVMTEQGQFIEVQGTAETQSFDREQLNAMLDLASDGIAELISAQKQALGSIAGTGAATPSMRGDAPQ